MEARWNPPMLCSGPSSPGLGCDPWVLAMLIRPSCSMYGSAYNPSFPLARLWLFPPKSSSGFTSRLSRMALGQGEMERAEGLALDIRSLGIVLLLGTEPCREPNGILEGDGGMEWGVGERAPCIAWCAGGIMGGCLRGCCPSRTCTISLCI